jgi:hypothetical protein
MFRTEDINMIGLPGMFGEGLANWHEISRLIKTHWYQLSVLELHDGRISEVTRMADSEKGLQQLLVKQGLDFEIIEIQVMTPSYMNGTSRWEFEPLAKVTTGKDKSGCTVCLIEVESGSVYHTSHQKGFNSSLLTNLRPIFLASMIRAPTL